LGELLKRVKKSVIDRVSSPALIQKTSRIAKISCPTINSVSPRKRLFRLLDESFKLPVIWVSGPPGSGKTTLIANYVKTRNIPCLWYQVDEGDSDMATFYYYMGMAAKIAAPHKREPMPLLTSEYMAGVATFSRRYFEELFLRTATPFTIVFDNYHEIMDDSLLHEVIARGCEVIPDGMHIVIASRKDTPPDFARLRANNRIAFLDWNALRFTTGEIKDLLHIRGKKRQDTEMLQSMQQKTEGWVAGIILMMKSTLAENGNSAFFEASDQQQVFDYFASEMFDRMNGQTRDFLLKTAFPTRVSPEIAQKLTGIKRSGHILFELSRNHCFTERHVHEKPVYQYHPLFREFLIERAKKIFSEKEISIIRKQAAYFLRESGQVEDAALLLSESHDWQELIKLICDHAGSLAGQGRVKTIEDWIKAFPEEIAFSEPWLLYWLGVCRIPFSPDESKTLFKKAFSLFSNQHDIIGLYLTWSGIVDSLIHGTQTFQKLDKWIAVLYDLRREYPLIPSGEIEAHVATSMLMALTMRQPYHPEFELWAEKALTLSHQSSDINIKVLPLLALASHRLFSGELSKAITLIDSVREIAKTQNISPLIQIQLKDVETFYYWLAGVPDKQCRVVQEALELASAKGIHIMDSYLYGHGAACALCTGDLNTAWKFIERMAKNLDYLSAWQKAFYWYLKTRECLLNRDLSHAALSADLSLQFCKEAGMPQTEAVGHIGKSYVLIALGRFHEAAEYVIEAYTIGKAIQNHMVEFMCYLLQAELAYSQDDEISGRAWLAKAMTLGKEMGYGSSFYWLPSNMVNLCMKALEAGIEVEYVQNLIRKRDLVPAMPPVDIEEWPWHLMIYTLGRLEFIRKGKAVHFTGKIQQKPLMMLKTIIALGGKEIRKERITDLLWPDAEGDAAHSSFTTTLSRLRRLIESDHIIKFQDGMISIHDRYCWVDAWSFERIFRQAEKFWNKKEEKGAVTEAMRLTEKALQIYKGHFLPHDTECVWTISYRERLRSRFLRLVMNIGNHMEQTNQWKKAIEYYQRALEIDDLAEEFYQHLMICCYRLGQQSEAIEVYRRCHNTLQAVLGSDPSARTTTVYNLLFSGRR
jgi:LuxR family transcriptional regulator, maltose regulon positive regulatory protein